MKLLLILTTAAIITLYCLRQMGKAKQEQKRVDRHVYPKKEREVL